MVFAWSSTATDVPRSTLTIEGADKVTWFRSSEKVQRGFCSICGSTLFWDAAAFHLPQDVDGQGQLSHAPHEERLPGPRGERLAALQVPDVHADRAARLPLRQAHGGADGGGVGGGRRGRRLVRAREMARQGQRQREQGGDEDRFHRRRGLEVAYEAFRISKVRIAS